MSKYYYEFLKREKTWDSGLKIIKTPVVKIPFTILQVCIAIANKIPYEFSILVKAKRDSEGYELLEDYVIPEQEVTYVSVDYTEDLEKYKKQGYIAIIHRHPDGAKSFSTADEESINVHFPVSILFVDGNFATAVISVPFNNDTIIQVEAEIQMIHPDVAVKGIENITVKEEKRWGSWRNDFPYL